MREKIIRYSWIIREYFPSDEYYSYSYSQVLGFTNYSYSYSYRSWLCESIPIPIRGKNNYSLITGFRVWLSLIQGTTFYSCWNFMKPGSESAAYVPQISEVSTGQGRIPFLKTYETLHIARDLRQRKRSIEYHPTNSNYELLVHIVS